jgi:hypothetical protein
MENIDIIRNELNIMLENAERINREIQNISINITRINEGNNKIILLRTLLEQIAPITIRLRELNQLNNLQEITETFIDDEGIYYQVILLDELNGVLLSNENMLGEKLDIIYSKVSDLEKFGEGRLIPDNPNNPQELEYFNENIINQSTCSICLIRVVNIKIDCGHLFCSNCVINIYECPLCTRQIDSLSKIYLKKYLKYRNKYIFLKKNRLL